MFLSLLVHVEIVQDFKEELVKRCYILVVFANSNSNVYILNSETRILQC